MNQTSIGTSDENATSADASAQRHVQPSAQLIDKSAQSSSSYKTSVDTSSLGNLLSQSAQNQQGFLAHLLGLDHDGGDQSGTIHNGVRSSPTNRQNPTLWLSALKSMRLSDFAHGLEFTPAMGMFFLFAGFFVWLFILYGIRQNEQLANALLGAEPNSNTAWAYDPRKPAHNGIQFLGTSPSPKLSPTDNTLSQSSSSSNSLPNQRFGSPFGDGPTAQTRRVISSHALGGAGMSLAAPISQTPDSPSFTDNQPILRAFDSTQTNIGRASFAVATEQNGSRRKLKFIVNN
jgi:hypothetical protein